MSFDLFFFWRHLLTVIVLCYCAVTMGDRLIGAWRLLHGPEPHWGYARKYLVIQLLRVGLRDVGWELVQIAFWLTVLGVLIGGHWVPPVAS